MSPLATLYAALVAMYLLECLVIARSNTMVFAYRRGTGKWRLLQGLGLEGLRARVYLGPLLPWRSVMSAQWQESETHSSFDLREAEVQFQAFKMRSRTLCFLCSAMTAHLLVFSPAVITFYGWRASWVVVTFILVILSIAIAIDARGIVRELAGPNAEVFALVTPALLSPVAASRALTSVTRLCFKAFHPLVVYRLLCSADQCQALAAGLLSASDDEGVHLQTQEARFLRTEFVEHGDR